MSDKVAVICTIALVRAIGLLASVLATEARDRRVAVVREEVYGIEAELQKLGNDLR